jgi:hypothetical protein
MNARLERLLARALCAEDPVASLRQAARDEKLDAATRMRLERADADGVRIAALLIARLRFERLIAGCPEAEAWFETDPAAFTRALRDYHHAVPPTAYFPAAEARLWRFHQGTSRRTAPLPESAITSEPSGATAIPIGAENAAAPPVPSASPARPEPATVATVDDASESARTRSNATSLK